MRGICGGVGRRLVRNSRLLLFGADAVFSSVSENVAMSFPNRLSFSLLNPSYNSTIAPTTSIVSMFPSSQAFYRNLCSSSSGPSNFVLVESEEKFNSSLRKVQDESLPAIFYFTAVWCGPCRLLSPIIGQLSEKYPRVTTYKIDIDQDLGSALSKLDIHSVPTLHFFKNGKKASEVIGADVQRLQDTMEELYK